MVRPLLIALALAASACGASAAPAPPIVFEPLPALAADAEPLLARALRSELRANAEALRLTEGCRASARVRTDDRGGAGFDPGARAVAIDAEVDVALACPDEPTRDGSARASALAPDGTGSAGRRRALEIALAEAARFAVIDLADSER